MQVHRVLPSFTALIASLVSLTCVFLVCLAFSASPTQANEAESPAGAGMDASVLEPGDVVQIHFQGEADFAEPFSVDTEGRLDLPEMGLFQVGGLSIAEAEEKIRALMGVMFRDAERMTLSRVSSMRLIQVLGYVKNPGPVSLDARGNIQTAIQQAGGLLPGAQLDRMQVQRGAERIPFSYKSYLDSGDQTFLPTLKTLDVVFIPASPLTGNVQIEFDAATLSASGDAADKEQAFSIFGEVRTPGRYSYRDNISIIDALMRAGGVTRYAGVEQIRVITSGEPVTFNLKRYLESGNGNMMPALTAGATIFVPIQEEEIKTGNNMVYVMGEVFKPGAFESKQEASLLDILANAGGPTRFAESRQIRILRANGEVVPFDLQAYTEGHGSGQLPSIRPGDAMFVPEKTDTNESSWLKVPTERSIRIIGQVNNPGRFEWSDEMTLLDLLAHAEGPTGRADIANLRILSSTLQGKIQTQVFNLDRFFQQGGDGKEIPKLGAGFTVVVPELPQDPSDNTAQWVRQSRDTSIYIMGQVGAPGRYMFNDEMSFLDILSAADGPNSNADLHHIRIVHRNEPHASTTHFNLSEYFETGDETLLPVVKPGDTIFIPEKERNWLDKPKDEMVRVIGAVNKPGRYYFNDQMTLLDLLAEAGGTTDSAYLDRLVVVNTATPEAQSTSFDLLAFMKTPDMSKLPVIRAGDTLFIPEEDDSNWRSLMEGVGDVFQVISIIAIIGVL